MANNKEDDLWKGIRNQFKWNMYQPNINKEYKILVFDDGYDKYVDYTNKWYIYGDWKGKVALVNCMDFEIRIGSISQWKIEHIV